MWIRHLKNCKKLLLKNLAGVWVCSVTSWAWSDYTQQIWHPQHRRHQLPIFHVRHYQQQSRWGQVEVEAVWSAATALPGSTTVCRAATAAVASSSALCVATCSTSARLTAGASSTPLDVTSARPVVSRSACVSTWTRTVSDNLSYSSIKIVRLSYNPSVELTE